MHSLSYSTNACCSYNLENLLNPCPCFHCVLTVLIRLNQNPYHLWSAHPVQQIRTFQVLCLFFTLPQTQIGSINALLLESLYIMSSSWNYVRYTQEKIATQNNISSNAVKKSCPGFLLLLLATFQLQFSFFCYWEYQATTHFDLEGSLEGSFHLIKISVYGTQKVIWWTTQSWTREPSSCKMLQNLPTIPVNSIGLFVWFPQRGCYISHRDIDGGGRYKKIKLHIITKPETQQRKRERKLWDTAAAAAAAAHLPCSWSFTKINKPSTREKGQIVKELKNLTAWLMNGGDNSASIPC
jgi:hypothetical protein